MRMQVLCLVLSASLLACGTSLTAAELKSGPKVGEKLPSSFQSLSVIDAGMPDVSSGRRWDHVEQYGSNPVVLVLARTDSDPVTKLVESVDAEVARYKMDNKKVQALLVILSDDDDLEKRLKDMAEKHKIKHVSLSIGSPTGPPRWRIAKDADVTVILYNRRKVEANHAFRKGELNDKAIWSVLADLPKIVRK